MTGRRKNWVWFQTDTVLALILLVIGTWGLLDVRYGTWRPGPGIGSHLVPAIAFGALIVAAIPLLVMRRRSPPDPISALRQSPSIALALLWSCAFFVAVLEIGLVVATGAFLAVAFMLLRGDADRQPLRDLGVAALGAGLIGLLFTRLAPILVSEPLLF